MINKHYFVLKNSQNSLKKIKNKEKQVKTTHYISTTYQAYYH